MRQAVKRLADLDKVVYLLKTIWRKLTDDHSNLEDDMAKKAEVKMVGVAAFSSSFLGARLVPSKWPYLVPSTGGYPGNPGEPQAVWQRKK